MTARARRLVAVYARATRRAANADDGPLVAMHSRPAGREQLAPAYSVLTSRRAAALLLVQLQVSSLPRVLVLRATDMDGRRAPCVLCGAVAMALADALSVDHAPAHTVCAMRCCDNRAG